MPAVASDAPPGTSAADLAQMLVQLTLNVVSDNARQTPEHAVQGMKLALKIVNDQYPRVNEAFIWSDGAQEYVNITTLYALLIADVQETTGMRILSHNHSIPGEGKGGPDMHNGHMAQALLRLKQKGGEGSVQTTGAEVVDAMNLAGLKGTQNFLVYIKNERHLLKAPPRISSYYSKEAGSEGGVVARCYSNIGSGTNINVQCAASDAVTTLIAVVAGGDDSDDDAAPAAPPPPALVKESRKLLLLKKLQRAKEAEAAKQAARELREQEPRLQQRAQLLGDLAQRTEELVCKCPKCGKPYAKNRKAALEAHVENCEEAPARSSYKDRASDSIGKAVNAEEESFAGSAASTVTLRVDSDADVRALQLKYMDQEDLHAHGLEYQGREDMDAGSWVIGITTSDNAFIATFAAPGAVLRTAVEVGEGGGTFTAQEWWEPPRALPALLTFQLKPPPVPARGWARKGARRGALKLTDEQQAFLFGEWQEDNKITAYALKEKMDKQFRKREELQLFEEDINQWLSCLYSQQRRQKGKATAGEEGDGEWEQEGDEAA